MLAVFVQHTCLHSLSIDQRYYPKGSRAQSFKSSGIGYVVGDSHIAIHILLALYSFIYLQHKLILNRLNSLLKV